MKKIVKKHPAKAKQPVKKPVKTAVPKSSMVSTVHRHKPDRLAFMTADLIRGHIETIILANLLGEDTYGYEINKRVMALTDGKYDLKEATLYSAFRRLEAAGLVSSYWGTEDSGSRRRYYKITDEGKKTYWSRKVDWDKAKEIIDRLIKEV